MAECQARRGRGAGSARSAGGAVCGESPGSAGDTLPDVARLDRLHEFVDRLHPSGLLYATYEHRLIAEFDHDRLPHHVAVLADGNRRWARANAPGSRSRSATRPGPTS